ncbi:hypothetical protein HYV30_03950 [Candidatus Kaiserbacteria bacterium]|nr:hypothetical protein [Candidatus Kaiserbacteria bacterium]
MPYQAITVFACVAAVFELTVVVQGTFAWLDGYFWPSQMPTRHGLPFAAHGGMWGDLVLSLLFAGMVTYAYMNGGWSLWAVVLAAALGYLGSHLMHETYKGSAILEAHVRHGKLTEVGWVHEAYMAAALAIILLYYFASPYTIWMWLVSAVLVVHVFVGNHMVLGMIAPKWYPGRPLASVQGWVAIGGTAVLTFGITALRALRVW